MVYSKTKDSEAEDFSRRGFLKKLGAGLIGLGISLAPVSALKLSKDGIFRNNRKISSEVISTETITAVGGSSPAADVEIIGITEDQIKPLRVDVYLESEPSFSTDYAFNYDYALKWDDTNNQMNLLITVNWDIDPGSGNDIVLRAEVDET